MTMLTASESQESPCRARSPVLGHQYARLHGDRCGTVCAATHAPWGAAEVSTWAYQRGWSSLRLPSPPHFTFLQTQIASGYWLVSRSARSHNVEVCLRMGVVQPYLFSNAVPQREKLERNGGPSRGHGNGRRELSFWY